MRYLLHITTAASALALAAPAAARDSGPAALDELVVTAARAPARLDQTGQQMTVLTAEDLRRLQTPLVADILARTPGVSFSRNGPVGSVTYIYVRGAEAGQTVVLLDGVKLNNPAATDTAFNFGNLLIGDVSRIEILRGPQSVLWGSQAIGGVVNLITTEPARTLEADATAEGGSRAWGMGRVGLGGHSDRLAWRASAAYLSTSGVSSYAGGAERDGFRHVGASGRARVTLNEAASLDLRAVYMRGRVEFDGFPAPAFAFADTREFGITDDFVGYAGLNLSALGGRLQNRLALAYTDTGLKNFDPAQVPSPVTFSSRAHNRRLEYQGTLSVAEGWTAVFGAETERSAMRSGSAFSADRRHARLTSGYVHLSGDVSPDVTLAGGLRHDDHSDFDGHTVGQASLAWRIDAATVVRASWAQAFKAPSLYQLGSQYGNGALRPETSTGWDAGVDQQLFGGRLQVAGAWFERRTHDQIDFVSCTFGSTADPLCAVSGRFRFGYYANVARTKAHGVELSARADLTDALRLSANYTWLHARNAATASANFGRPLGRRPSHAANAELDYRLGPAASTQVSVRYVGARPDDASGFRRLKSATVWDLRGAYAVAPRVELFGRVENLFDATEVTAAGYGSLGRSAYAGVRARF